MAKILACSYGEDVLGPLTAARREPKLTTSKLLPQILELKEQGLTYREIGERLGISRNSVDHVVVRHRERQRKQQKG